MEGGQPQPFVRTNLSANTFALEWAPGSRILYQQPGNRNFSVLDPLNGDERPLISDDSVGWMFNPRYDPGGGLAAAYWNRQDRGLWTVGLDGEAARQVLPLATPGPTVVGWSLDGEWIDSLEGANEPPTIERIPRAGGTPALVATLPWPDVAMCDTVDGSLFVCAVSEGQSV